VPQWRHSTSFMTRRLRGERNRSRPDEGLSEAGLVAREDRVSERPVFQGFGGEASERR
jgi:hypothetical protein